LPKGGIPLFGKEGLGEILEEYVWSIMDFLVSSKSQRKRLMPEESASRIQG
jgi:hypothetical protein